MARIGVYRKSSDISCTFIGIKLLITQMQLEHRLPALLQLHIHSQLNTWLQWIGQRQLQDEIVWGIYNNDLGQIAIVFILALIESEYLYKKHIKSLPFYIYWIMPFFIIS